MLKKSSSRLKLFLRPQKSRLLKHRYLWLKHLQKYKRRITPLRTALLQRRKLHLSARMCSLDRVFHREQRRQRVAIRHVQRRQPAVIHRVQVRQPVVIHRVQVRQPVVIHHEPVRQPVVIRHVQVRQPVDIHHVQVRQRAVIHHVQVRQPVVIRHEQVHQVVQQCRVRRVI